MPASDFPLSLQPYTLAGLPLRNRIFVSGHTTNFGENLLPTDVHAAYHAERARGGVGLIFTEGIRVHPSSLSRQVCIIGYDEAALPGFRRIVEATKAEGAAIFAQILHTGRQNTNVHLRMPPWSSSATPWAVTGDVPHAMSQSQMREVVNSFVVSAQMMRDAGFDGLEVHFGHGHLLHQFMSPAVNKRTDEYGGSEENRLRFPVEVLQAVLKAVGDDMIVGIRVSGDEFVADGLDLEASCRMIKRAHELAPVKFINASHSAYAIPSTGFHVADMHYGPMPFRYITYAIADAVPDVPVFAICRYTSLDMAEDTLKSGKVALVGMTRAHIADPHIIKKTQEGRDDEIRPCVSCNYCIGQLAGNLAITCLMNPTVGKEREWPVVPEKVADPRKILVIGGGPAGLEAARIAAERGHTVAVWEAGGELGGQLNIGKRAKGRSDLGKAVEYYDKQMRRLGVDVALNKPATVDDVLAFGADEVILASGSRPSKVTIEGYGEAITAHDALANPLDRFSGKHVVLIDGNGSWTSSSAAETIAASGARVTIVTAADAVLWDINLYSKGTTLDRLGKLGVLFRTLRRPVSFKDGTLTTRDVWTGTLETVEDVDLIVSAAPSTAEDSLLAGLEGKVAVRPIGDTQAPRRMLEAVYEGHVAGRAV